MRFQLRSLLPFLCLLVSFQITGGQQPSTVNLRPGSVASQPGVPQVRVTVDRQRVRLGTEVTFSLTPASAARDYIVTLYFGDLDKRGNRQSEVMRAPQTTHLYQEVGTYTYAVDVKHRQAPPCDPRVTLSATPNSVPESQPVSFSAQLSERCPNIQYRFFFGDGSSTSWQSSLQTQHSYPRAGRYLAYVDVNDGNRRVGGSPRRPVDVTARGNDPLTVSLSARPLPARARQPVSFTAIPSAQRAGARYRFQFGDGTQSSWQTDPQTQHAYRRAGNYRAYVQVSQNNLNPIATSPLLTVTSIPDSNIDPTQRPTPTPTSRTTPTPQVNPSPTPPSGSSSPNASPTPPDGSSSPGGSPSPPNGSTSPGGSPGSGTNSTTVGSSSNGSEAGGNPLLSPSGKRWWYLLIALLILLAIYQATGYLFVAQPTFTPFPDAGVAAVAAEKGAAPFGFELLLDPSVSDGDYSMSTDAPRLITNDPPAEERQVIEI